jgi:hypothetical protein
LEVEDEGNDDNEMTSEKDGLELLALMDGLVEQSKDTIGEKEITSEKTEDKEEDEKEEDKEQDEGLDGEEEEDVKVIDTVEELVSELVSTGSKHLESIANEEELGEEDDDLNVGANRLDEGDENLVEAEEEEEEEEEDEHIEVVIEAEMGLKNEYEDIFNHYDMELMNCQMIHCLYEYSLAMKEVRLYLSPLICVQL